jgi:hypothetical protein
MQRVRDGLITPQETEHMKSIFRGFGVVLTEPLFGVERQD